MTATQKKSWSKGIGIILFLGVFAAIIWQIVGAKTAAPPLTFQTLTQKQLSLPDLKGKVVLVNFWATSCPGCIKEMPELVKLYQSYQAQKKPVELIAVAMQYDSEQYVRHYQQANQLPFPVVLDQKGDIAHQFGDIKLTPTLVMIDPHGNIIQQYLGEVNPATLREKIDQLIQS